MLERNFFLNTLKKVSSLALVTILLGFITTSSNWAMEEDRGTIKPGITLPKELLTYVFSFCNREEVGKMALVSKEWKAASEDETLWKSMQERFRQIPCPTFRLEHVRICKSILSLQRVINYPNGVRGYWRIDGLQNLSSTVTKIETITRIGINITEEVGSDGWVEIVTVDGKKHPRRLYLKYIKGLIPEVSFETMNDLVKNYRKGEKDYSANVDGRTWKVSGIQDYGGGLNDEGGLIPGGTLEPLKDSLGTLHEVEGKIVLKQHFQYTLPGENWPTCIYLNSEADTCDLLYYSKCISQDK